MAWFLRIAWMFVLPSSARNQSFHNLALENLALRQQLAVLQRRLGGQRQRVRIDRGFRVIWVLLCRRWPQWKHACLLVKPSTVIAWHRAGFKLFWKWKSRPKGKQGRPAVCAELRMLIRRFALENPFWGAPRIHGELAKLGFHISERSVQRWIPKRPKDPRRAQNWRSFLTNHRELIAAMDFLTVQTWNYRQLYVLIFIDHGRRVIRHVNVTAHPTAEWVKQQLREAFPFDGIPKYLLFDRDTTFGAIKGFVKSMGIVPKQTSYHCPWQNGICERMVGSLRRDLLDHVIVLNEEHLRRLLKDYLRYYHEDRTHLGLNKDSPRGRPIRAKPAETSQVVSLSRCGGLHHRYHWDSAA